MFGTYTTGAAGTWAESPGDLVGRLQEVMAEMRASRDRLGLVDCLVMLRDDAEAVRRTTEAPKSVLDRYDTLAGLPLHVVDSVMEGRILAAELRLKGKRVGVVGAIAPPDGVGGELKPLTPPPGAFLPMTTEPTFGPSRLRDACESWRMKKQLERMQPGFFSGRGPDEPEADDPLSVEAPK